MSQRPREEEQTGVALREREEQKVERPRRYRVLLHNDDYTPMEFVVRLLRQVFHRSESEATAIMLHVHNRGVGVAGVYSHEIAETKVAQVHIEARKSEVPLMASMEPDEDGEDDDA